MKENAEFITISNSVDTHGVCWLFGWGYFWGQSANKTRKKAEILKFEILFPEDQDVHMRQQTFKVNLKMLMSYFYESRPFFCGDDREKFVTKKEDTLNFASTSK